MLLMVMGVSGSGKTTLGKAVALQYEATFLDGDDLHPPGNIEKMRRGEALNDADREPWLQRLDERLRAASGQRERLVIACSALKRRYRQQFLASAPTLQFVYLKAHQETLVRRLGQRSGHFMPPSLLLSQFDTLEEPDPSEPAWIIDADQSLEIALERVLMLLGAQLKCREARRI